MRYIHYYRLMAVSSVISWVLFLLTVIFISPNDLGSFGVLIFFIALGIASFTSFALILSYIRINLLHLSWQSRFGMFREGLLFSLLPIVILLFFHYDVFTFFKLLLTIMLWILVDIILIIKYGSQKYYKRTRANQTDGD